MSMERERARECGPGAGREGGRDARDETWMVQRGRQRARGVGRGGGTLGESGARERRSPLNLGCCEEMERCLGSLPLYPLPRSLARPRPRPRPSAGRVHCARLSTAVFSCLPRHYLPHFRVLRPFWLRGSYGSRCARTLALCRRADGWKSRACCREDVRRLPDGQCNRTSSLFHLVL